MSIRRLGLGEQRRLQMALTLGRDTLGRDRRQIAKDLGVPVDALRELAKHGWARIEK